MATVRFSIARSPRRTGRLRGRDGFTLVEALASFVILALLTLVAQRSLVMARTGLARAEARTEAERVALSLLDEPLARTASGRAERSGVTDGRRWTVSAEPLDLPPARTATPPARPDPAGQAQGAATGAEPAPAVWRPLRVTVRVEAAPGRTLAVETVRLARADRE